jgi:hypothetical protein
MTEAFRQMRLVHETLLLLEQAAKLPLINQDQRVLQALLADLTPDTGWTLESLTAFERGSKSDEVYTFLASLR